MVRGEEYALPDPGLTDEERAALWLAAQVVRMGGQAPDPGGALQAGRGPAGLLRGATGRRHRGSGGRPGGPVHRGDRGPPRGLRLPGQPAPGAPLRAGASAGALVPGGTAGGGEGGPGLPGRPPRRPAGRLAARRLHPAGGVPRRRRRARGPLGGRRGGIEVTVRFDPSIAWWARRQLPAGAAVEEERRRGSPGPLPGGRPGALHRLDGGVRGCRRGRSPRPRCGRPCWPMWGSREPGAHRRPPVSPARDAALGDRPSRGRGERGVLPVRLHPRRAGPRPGRGVRERAPRLRARAT